MSKLNGDVYVEAAKRVCQSTSNVACVSIRIAQGWSDIGKYVREFNDIFQPDEVDTLLWYGDFTKENQTARSLALLFMAEMVKSNDV